MKIRVVIFLLLALVLVPSMQANDEVKKIAILEVFDGVGNVSQGLKLAVRAKLSIAITNTPGYEALTRINMDAIMDEHGFQHSGNVTDEQIKMLGEMSGADYVLIAEVAYMDDTKQEIAIFAQLNDIETAQIVAATDIYSKTDTESITASCRELARRLLGKGSNDDDVFTSVEKIIEKFKELYAQGNYNEAFKLITSPANQGNAYAQYCLGFLYYNGQGVAENYSEAVKWFTLSANQGNAYAQYMLGSCYYRGQGVTMNDSEAVKWFTLSANQGNVNAQVYLGALYYNGQGVAQNYSEAVKWYTLSANQGDVLAQGRLGELYYNGQGVAQNYSEAVKWYTLSANQGDVLAQGRLGELYYNGQGVAQNYSEAVKWFTLSANQGYKEAQLLLARCYYYGQGVTQNYSEAARLISDSVGQKVTMEELRFFISNL